MIVRIRLFALARQLAGSDTIEVLLADGQTVADLRTAMLGVCPALAPVLPFATFAVAAQYAADSQVLDPSSDVACIPPVSGG